MLCPTTHFNTPLIIIVRLYLKLHKLTFSKRLLESNFEENTLQSFNFLVVCTQENGEIITLLLQIEALLRSDFKQMTIKK